MTDDKHSKLSYDEYLAETAEILQKNANEKEKYMVEMLGRSFVVYPNVFSPKYFLDTEFFTRALPVRTGETLLEIGSGVGATVVFAALRGAAHVTAVDINPSAVENTKENAKLNGVENKVTVLRGDVYDSLKRGVRYDTIYWNTPFGYVDENENITMLEKAVFDPGYKATHKFVREARDYLNKGGRLLIGFSTTLGKFDVLHAYLEEAGFSVRLVAKTQSVEAHPVLFEIFEARLPLVE